MRRNSGNSKAACGALFLFLKEEEEEEEEFAFGSTKTQPTLEGWLKVGSACNLLFLLALPDNLPAIDDFSRHASCFLRSLSSLG